MPNAPIQLRAHGLRATEIAALNPRGSTNDGPFQDWNDANATIIWAAHFLDVELMVFTYILVCLQGYGLLLKGRDR